jgi:hypothetical protein
MSKKPILAASLIALGTCALVSTSAQAQTIAQIKAALGTASANTTATLTSNPVVTEIIATTATYNTLLIQDGTGAIEVYKVPTTLYATPAVGDTISGTATFTSFHGLYEMEATYTSFGKTGTATLPTPSVFTTTGLTNGSTIGNAQQSTLGTLSGVSFTATGNFASGGTYTVSDANGSATIYVPSGDPIIGQAIPTGPANIYGYLGQYDTAATAFGSGSLSYNGYELDPLSVTAAGGSAATPEPAALMSLLTGSGFLGLAAIRRRASRS